MVDRGGDMEGIEGGSFSACVSSDIFENAESSPSSSSGVSRGMIDLQQLDESTQTREVGDGGGENFNTTSVQR